MINWEFYGKKCNDKLKDQISLSNDDDNVVISILYENVIFFRIFNQLQILLLLKTILAQKRLKLAKYIHILPTVVQFQTFNM